MPGLFHHSHHSHKSSGTNMSGNNGSGLYYQTDGRQNYSGTMPQPQWNDMKNVSNSIPTTANENYQHDKDDNHNNNNYNNHNINNNVTKNSSFQHNSSNANNSMSCSTNGTVRYLTPFPLTGPECVHHNRIYRLASKADCLSFRNFADSLDGFTLCYNRPCDLLVWEKKIAGEPMHVIKALAVFRTSTSKGGKITPSLLYDMLQDSIFRETWDQYRREAFRIVRLDATNDIGYYAAYSPVPLVKNRDFVNQRAWHDAGNGGEYVIFNTSVPHDAVPRKYQKEVNHNKYGSFIRAKSKLSGYFIQQWYDPVTGVEDGASITFITQADPGGWIPAALTNYIASKFAPNTVSLVANALVTFQTWLPAQLASGKYVKDWEMPSEWWVTPEEQHTHPIYNRTIDFARRTWGGSSGANVNVARPLPSTSTAAATPPHATAHAM